MEKPFQLTQTHISICALEQYRAPATVPSEKPRLVSWHPNRVGQRFYECADLLDNVKWALSSTTENFPQFSFPWWKAGVRWKTSAVACCCWREICYWTGQYPVASTAWFIWICSAKPLSGSVYSPLLPSVLKNNSPLVISQLETCLLVQPTQRSLNVILVHS